MTSTLYLLDYPIPLDNDFLGHLHLPRDGLTEQDAERIAEYVKTLVLADPVSRHQSKEGES